jgi:hypothetical protein
MQVLVVQMVVMVLMALEELLVLKVPSVSMAFLEDKEMKALGVDKVTLVWMEPKAYQEHRAFQVNGALLVFLGNQVDVALMAVLVVMVQQVG